MANVAEWLRRRTKDLGVWVSIPAAPVMCKSLEQYLNPHRLCPPSGYGYQAERWYCGKGCSKLRCIPPREMRL